MTSSHFHERLVLSQGKLAVKEHTGFGRIITQIAIAFAFSEFFRGKFRWQFVEIGDLIAEANSELVQSATKLRSENSCRSYVRYNVDSLRSGDRSYL